MSQPMSQDEINTIFWKACDIFRISTLDPYEYKNYILVMFFLKYISDVWQERYDQLYQQHGGDQQRIDHQLKHEWFILPKDSDYYTLYHKRSDDDIGDQINKALSAIERENPQKLTRFR